MHDLETVKLRLSFWERKVMQKRSVFGYKVKQFFLGFEERLYAKKDGETYR